MRVRGFRQTRISGFLLCTSGSMFLVEELSFYFEQQILKHDAAVQAIRIKQMHQGIDFFFGNRSHAIKFVGILDKFVPVMSRSDKQLVSHDSKNNTYNYKHTFSVDICPICRGDLVCLPPKAASSFCSKQKKFLHIR